MNATNLKAKIAETRSILAALEAELAALEVAPVAVAIEDVKLTIFRAAGKSHRVDSYFGGDRPACRPNKPAYGSTFEGHGGQVTCKTCSGVIAFVASEGKTSM